MIPVPLRETTPFLKKKGVVFSLPRNRVCASAVTSIVVAHIFVLHNAVKKVSGGGRDLKPIILRTRMRSFLYTEILCYTLKIVTNTLLMEPTTEQNKNNNNFNVPLAIIIAGVLVAGSIMYVGFGGK